MTITNLLETTWLARYPCPMEIIYDHIRGFFVHRFKNTLIEEKCRIKAKPETAVNPQANYIIE